MKRRASLREVLGSIGAGAVIVCTWTGADERAASGRADRFRVALITDGRAGSITEIVARALGHRYNRRTDTLTIGGVGMDKGLLLKTQILSAAPTATVYNC